MNEPGQQTLKQQGVDLTDICKIGFLKPCTTPASRACGVPLQWCACGVCVIRETQKPLKWTALVAFQVYSLSALLLHL